MAEKRKWSVPEACALRAKDFGRSGFIEWHQPRTFDQLIALRHAEVQHQFAMRVKAIIRGRVTQREVATACDFGQTRFNEVLNGRAWLGFDDMVRIEQVLGPILLTLQIEHAKVTHPDLVGYPRHIGREPESRAATLTDRPDSQPELTPAAMPRQRLQR